MGGALMADDAGLETEPMQGDEFAEQTGALLQRLINNGALEEQFAVMSFAQAVPIAKALREHYYKERGAFDESFADDLKENLYRRQSKFESYLVPWIDRVRPLADATVADIGCGTGASTAALARHAAAVVGYEISHASATVARARIASLGLNNARVSITEPEVTLQQIREDFPNGVDVITLIAVLEHMTETERASFLTEVWAMMKPGSILVMAETPNRLTYLDEHTSKLPFFQMLPPEIAVRYYNRSSRAHLTNGMDNLNDKSLASMRLALNRWGLGISYHDFELGFKTDNLETVLLADGFEAEPFAWFPPSLEERLLADYFVKAPISKPMGFTRCVLNMIFARLGSNVTHSVFQHEPEHIIRLASQHRLPGDVTERLLRVGTV
jgi:2-polyprenyl-3-methyl-5-hydroxy-6-metoxy-1,4-benzoquinol methylase